jgi:DNA-binding beta-propeller fold protein YncE
VVATWHVGGYPDMVQLNPDGTQIWASSRYDGNVLVIDARTGQLLHKISCGAGAHGLTYFPAPGRISLGHNGVYR